MKTLREYRYDVYPTHIENCTAEENEEYNNLYYKAKKNLPKDIIIKDFIGNKSTYQKHVFDEDLTEEERLEFLLHKIAEDNAEMKKQNDVLLNEINNKANTMKNCCIFFTVLAVIGLVAGLILMYK